MQVNALQCVDCGDIIYSRARHDFHHCSCGKVFVDGGFDYLRYGFSDKKPKRVQKRIKATREQVYKDWNEQIDNYGWIKIK